MSKVTIIAGMAMDRGPRGVMEDAAAVATRPPFAGRRLAVFDGLGGMGDGATASRVAADVFQASNAPLREVAWQMHQAVRAAQTRCRCMTTFASVEFSAELSPSWSAQQGLSRGDTRRPMTVELRVAWSGDSCVYVLRRGVLTRVTEPHGWGRHVVKCLGSDNWSPQQTKIHVRPGDLVLLCTDGLHGVLNDADITQILTRRNGCTLDALARQLVTAALENGSDDNITAVLAEVA